MTHLSGTIVAPQSQWERIGTTLPSALMGEFLKVLDMIKKGGMESLPNRLARRVRDNLWDICISGPKGRYDFWIVSEAHGQRSRHINRNDGQIGLPLDVKRRMLNNADISSEWLLTDIKRGQAAALAALAGIEEEDWIIPPPRADTDLD